MADRDQPSRAVRQSSSIEDNGGVPTRIEEKRWGRVPIWLNRAVSGNAIRVFIELHEYVDYTTYEAWPSHQRLAESLGCSAGTISRGMTELEEIGVLSVTPRYRPDGGQTSNGYVLRYSRPDTPPSPNLTGAPPPDLTGAPPSNLRDELDPEELDPINQEDPAATQPGTPPKPGQQSLVPSPADQLYETWVKNRDLSPASLRPWKPTPGDTDRLAAAVKGTGLTVADLRPMIEWLFVSDHKDARFWRGHALTPARFRDQFPKIWAAWTGARPDPTEKPPSLIEAAQRAGARADALGIGLGDLLDAERSGHVPPLGFEPDPMEINP